MQGSSAFAIFAYSATTRPRSMPMRNLIQGSISKGENYLYSFPARSALDPSRREKSANLPFFLWISLCKAWGQSENTTHSESLS